MCDSVQPSVITPYGCTKTSKSQNPPFNSWNPLILGIGIGARDCSVINGRIIRVFGKREKIFRNQRSRNCLGVFGSNGFDLNQQKDEKFEVGFENDEGKMRNLRGNYEDDYMGINGLKREKKPSKFDVMGKDVEGNSMGENLIGNGNGKSGNLEEQKGKQLIRRSSIVAKQVIGIQSALSLGFVSQLWVDTTSWVVLEVEVRPSLLSSESGKFLLQDIKQVGDVVLVQDQSFILNKFRTVGLESLVGYNVVTPGKRNLGKVRGYTFNINSGAVESLELDAFGYSLIPSSLVTTYALLTEDVLDVLFDTIIVHEAAASRIPRLTMGLLGARNMETSGINLNYDDLDEEESTRLLKGRKSRRKSSKRKFYPRMRDVDDDLECPMDYM